MAAGTEGLSLSDMRELLREGLGGLDAQDLTNDEADRLLNMSFWALESRFPFKEKECRVSFDTQAGEESYNLPDEEDPIDLESIQSVSVMDDEGLSHKLTRMTVDWWDDANRTTDKDSRARPERYVRTANAIHLHPVPDDTYTIWVYLLKNLKNLVGGLVEAPNLPREWHEIVVEGAVARGQFYRQDYNQAQMAQNFAIGKMRSAVPDENKDEEDSRYAGLEVAWDSPE